MKRLLTLLLPFLLAVSSAFGQLIPGKTKVSLLLDNEQARAGTTITAAVRLQMPRGWHTYWRNPGESGDPTKIKWTLPAGVTAGTIQWPVPEKMFAQEIYTYGYHGEALLLVPLTLAADLKPGPLILKAKVSWLECEELCVLGDAEVSASLVVGAETKPSQDAAAIEAARKKLPGARINYTAAWDGPAAGDKRPLLIEFAAKESARQFDFFPQLGDGWSVEAKTEASAADGKVLLRKFVKKTGATWPTQIEGLIVEHDKEQFIAANEALVEIAEKPSAAPPVAGSLLIQMLLFAFLGGLILNVMPCVLPVIALKILGFVQQGKGETGAVRKLGVAYTMGVLFSFLILAGVVIGVQRAGGAATWGMQFADPHYLLVLLVIMTLVTLNLFGVFEVMLGGSTMTAASELASRQGISGAFFNGILATALATPCTAPILAEALGFAFSQPPLIVVWMFLAIGLGLASPYLVLSFQPDWLKFLPKPGAWMERFKVAMGFPMLATVFWILSVTASHFGKRGTLWLGIFVTFVALAAWVWGEFVQRGTARRGLAKVVCLLLFAVGCGYSYTQLTGRDEIPWKPWSTAAVAQARAEKRVVLVDFTADWCLTCKANKRTSIEVSSVRAKLKEVNAVALLADNTQSPPEIAAELKRHERAGVPLVLIYPKDGTSPPFVLPTLLTPGTVLEALEKAAK